MKRCDWFEAAEGQDGGTRESEVGLSWTALPSTKSGNMRERRSWGRGGWWVQFDYTVGYLDNKFNQIQTPGLEVMGQHQPFFLIPIFSNWRGHSRIPSVSSCPTRTLQLSGPRCCLAKPCGTKFILGGWLSCWFFDSRKRPQFSDRLGVWRDGDS